MGTAQFLLLLGGVVLLQTLGQGTTSLDVVLNVIAMIVIIGQSSVNIGEGQMGISIDNLVRRQPMQLGENVVCS